MKRGFTLIESLIYIALFAILIIGIVLSAFALFESSDRNQTKAMLQEEKDFLTAKINWALSGVNAVSAPSANASGSTLDVTKYDNAHVKVYLSGTDIFFATSTLPVALGTPVTLNNTNVFLSNLVFIHTYAGGINPESIEGGFTITTKMSNGMSISQTASTTRYIRK